MIQPPFSNLEQISYSFAHLNPAFHEEQRTQAKALSLTVFAKTLITGSKKQGSESSLLHFKMEIRNRHAKVLLITFLLHLFGKI